MFTPRFWTLASITLALAMTRVVPHGWNFTPVGAMCLFGGAYFTQRWAAFGVPLAALVLSDLVLAATLYGFDSFLYMPPVYLSFALIVGLGMLLRGEQRLPWPVRLLSIAGAAVGAAWLHYAITNFAVWLGQDIYPRTPEGLIACYVAAWPYFKSMLYSNLLYCGVLFGGFAWAQQQFPVLREPAIARAA